MFNMSNLNPGKKFDYPAGGTVTIRAVPAAELLRIQNTRTTTEVEYHQTKKGSKVQRIEVPKSDPEGIHDLWDYTIVDWEFTDAVTGECIPCTRENKVKLMGEVPEFYDFVDSKQEEAARTLKVRTEGAEKNFERS